MQKLHVVSFADLERLSQVWLFFLGPFLGATIAGIVYRSL